MLTHVHKLIHLVVGHLSKGGEVGEVEELIFTKNQWPDVADIVTELMVSMSGHL